MSYTKSITQIAERLRLEVLAEAKGLDPELLRKLGWEERPDGIYVPWKTTDGRIAWHVLHSLDGDWSWIGYNRDTLLPYGAQYLHIMLEKRPDVIVVGESENDTVALWQAGIPAIAVGGANGWQPRWLVLLKGFKRVVVLLEDAAGVRLVRALATSWPADAPPLYVAHSLDYYPEKDPCRILKKFGDKEGREKLRQIVGRAVPVKTVEGELIDAVKEHFGVRHFGQSFNVRCPFHHDRKPSLSVFHREQGWFFRCHACGVKGPLELLGAAFGLVKVEEYRPYEGAPRKSQAKATSKAKYLRQSRASRLVALTLAEAELWHSPLKEGFATVRVGDHFEHMPLRSEAFRQWLAQRYYELTSTDGEPGEAASKDDLSAAITTLEGIAKYGRPEYEIYVRVAPDGAGGIYIDLADEKWRAVHVTPNGWKIVTNPPVRFRRSPYMRPLPEPVRGGSLDELRALLNVKDEKDWALLLGWFIAAYWPVGPYPILVLRGEQGSAKSTTARIIRALIDPANPDLLAEPRNLHDLMITAQSNRLLVFDNVSKLHDWLSDALCRLATEEAFVTRKLFTDADVVVFEANLPVVLTSIVPIITRPDLADRCVVLDLPPIPETCRRSEAEIWRAFNSAAGRIFGAILDRLSGALREYGNVHLNYLPRMADFVIRAVAAERAAGEPSRFLAAYLAERAAEDEEAIDASPIGPALRELLAEHQIWEGTAAELLAQLSELAGERATRMSSWPQTPRALSGELRRLAPALRRALSVEVDFTRTHGGVRKIVLRKAEEEPPSPSGGGDGGVTVVTIGDDIACTTVTQETLDFTGVGDDGDDGDGRKPTLRVNSNPSIDLSPEKNPYSKKTTVTTVTTVTQPNKIRDFCGDGRENPTVTTVTQPSPDRHPTVTGLSASSPQPSASSEKLVDTESWVESFREEARNGKDGAG